MNSIPSQWTMLRLIVGLAIRRNIHQIFANIALANRTRKEFLADRRRHAEGATARVPTPRKQTTVGIFTVFFTGIIFLEVFLFSSMFLGSLSIERKLHPLTIHNLKQLPEITGLNCQDTDTYVRSMLYHDTFVSSLPKVQQDLTVDLISKHWTNEEWLNCGQELGPTAEFANLFDSYAHPVQHELLIKFTSLITILTLINILSGNLGNILPKNFGHTDAETLWFLSLPIPATTMFIAKVVEYVVQMENWLLVFPFMTMCAFVANHGWYAPFFGFITTIPIIIALASIRLCLETTMRTYIRPPIRKNIQIVFSFISTVLMLYIFYIVVKGKGFELWGGELLPWETLPTAWPLRAIFSTGFDFWYWWSSGVVVSTIVTISTITFAVYAVRNGFIAETDTMQGVRLNRTAKLSQSKWLPMSVMSKDLRMLRRDRLFLFNVLMTPVVAIGSQFLLNPELIDAVTHNFRHACTLAYVVAAYLLVPSATTLLSAEGPALWLLTSTPRPLLQLLQQKLLIWTSLALAYTALAFVGVILFVPWPGSAGIADVIMMVLGVPIFAVIAAGIGAANDDPNVIDPRLRINTSARTTLLMVMLMHGQAIYTTDWHTRLVWLTLCTVFAYSLWQRLEERLPWLLDPTDNPPERIDLTHGALAAMYFMVLQSLISIPLLWLEIAPAHILLIAFSGAGIITALGALWGFWRNNLPDILLNTGLIPRTAWHTALHSNLKLGIAGGVIAAIFGSAYILLLAQFPLIMSEIPKGDPIPVSILLAITVLAAPIAEEFIFRGLLFTGLAATIPIYWAVPASAAAFALIHPSFAVLPVFIMGCIAAITYHKSSWLLAPMLVHAIYNGVMVVTQLNFT